MAMPPPGCDAVLDGRVTGVPAVPRTKELSLDAPIVGRPARAPVMRRLLPWRRPSIGVPTAELKYVYGGLAVLAGIASLLELWLASNGVADAAATGLALAPVTATAAIGALLAGRGQERTASFLVAGSLVVLAYLVTIIHPDPGVAVTLPIIGFVMVLPYVRGAALVSVGIVVLVAMVLVIRASTIARAGLIDGLAIDVLFGGLATATVLMVLTWRLVRSREHLLDRMTRFVEGVPVGIFKTDASGRMVEVNGAVARLLGYPDSKALLGIQATDLLLHPAPESGALAGAIEERGARTGELELRRGDGSPIWVRYHIRSELDARGTIIGYEGALEDVSSDRTARDATARLIAWKQERSAILDALRRLQPGRTIDQTAESICSEIERGGDLSYAAVLELNNGHGATILAARSGNRRLTGTKVATQFATGLRQRAADGPWVEDVSARRSEPGYRRLAANGLRQLAFVPIEREDGVAALLVAGTANPDLDLGDRLHTLGEFAAHASALIGPALRARSERELLRDRIKDTIDRRAFSAVFQPIVDLETRVVLGYEALTRFDDGTPPDRMFADATACGMSVALETATLQAAMTASAPLPANRFIDLNVSPELVLAEEPLRTHLRDWGFNVVLEITEHVAITDYPALRAAFASLGDNVQVAVDDAGAGYASLRHITELRPQFVKLDRGLIVGIDSDLIRQALITGMVHFTDGVGSLLIAEGVETEAERATLRALGVRAAQGYLFARPQPADQVPR